MMTTGEFQSLVGFKINWNFVFPCFAPISPAKFQSLVGFKINWNPAGDMALYPEC